MEEPAGGPEWAVSLDDAPEPGVRTRQTLTFPLAVSALLLVAVLAGVLVWNPGPRITPPVPRVVGSHLFAPIAFTVPPGAVATSDSSYLGIRYTGGEALLVTAPTQVMTAAGTMSMIPADAPGWLRAHPAVFVSRVRDVRIGRVTGTQVDYRRSDQAMPRSTFAGTSLFCAPRPCTRITSGARVRATFLTISGRTVLAEAVWSQDAAPGGRTMPPFLRTSYQSLLERLAAGDRPR